jgi:hypothetical protein
MDISRDAGSIPAASIREGLTNPLKRKQARRFISAGLVRFTPISQSVSQIHDIHVSLIWGRGMRHYLVKLPRIALELSQSGDLMQRVPKLQRFAITRLTKSDMRMVFTCFRLVCSQ